MESKQTTLLYVFPHLDLGRCAHRLRGARYGRRQLKPLGAV